MASYAVAWSEEGDGLRIGKLELAGGGIRLEAGTHRDGRFSVRHVAFQDMVSAEMAPLKQRIGNRPTVVLTLVHGVVALAPTGMGVALEVLGHLQAALPEVAA
jgi:hypothetical protein